MIKNIFINTKHLIKFFYEIFHQFFITLHVFELIILKKNLLPNRKYFTLTKKSQIKKKIILINHFKKNSEKIERFKYAKFFGIEKDNKIVCYCWAGYKKTDRWYITEINKYVNFGKSIVLLDALTLAEYRNQGYYQDLLKYIQNNFLKKKIVVYIQSTKPESLKATKKTNFKKIGEMTKLNYLITSK